MCALTKTVGWGSPPRARGAGSATAAPVRRARITPACAGSWPRGTRRRPSSGDHPRVRGELIAASQIATLDTGSPPRAWGAISSGLLSKGVLRITPACAGS